MEGSATLAGEFKRAEFFLPARNDFHEADQIAGVTGPTFNAGEEGGDHPVDLHFCPLYRRDAAPNYGYRPGAAPSCQNVNNELTSPSGVASRSSAISINVVV